MSRSYKHTPRSGDTKNRFFKRYANRRFRRKPFERLHHKQYRKDFCYYDICDYESIGKSFEQFYRDRIKLWHQWKGYFLNHSEPFPTREEAWKDYKKWYIRK